MDVYQKYELIELLPGEGPKSFRARQRSQGREVTVHLMVGGQTSENQGLMARLRTLPPNATALMIEVGQDSQGSPYIVTVAPPFQHLLVWLKEQEHTAAPQPHAPAAQPDEFEDLFGQPRQIPTGQMAAAPAAPQPSASSPVASGPGEFTRMFQAATPAAPSTSPVPLTTGDFTQPFLSPAEPTMQRAAAAPPSPPTPSPVAAAPPTAPAPPPGESHLGEFTSLFQAVTPAAPPPPAPSVQRPAPAPPARPATPPAAAAPPAAPAPPPPESQMGEFTRLFKTPGPATPPASPVPLKTADFTQPFLSPAEPTVRRTAATPPAAPVPPPVQSQPQAGSRAGEFTQLFQAPAMPADEPVAPPPAAASGSPGNFTRMFQSAMPSTPATSDWAPPPPPPKEPGAFTAMFKAPPAAQQPEGPPKGGEFTQFFKGPPPGGQGPALPAVSGFPSGPAASAAPPPPPPQYSAPLGATQAFAVSQQAPAPASEEGPSAYTRMMAAMPSAGVPAAPPAPGFPQMAAMPQAPHMPQMPGMQLPPTPHMQAPQFNMPQPPPPVKPPSSNMLLMAILGLLMFLVGGFIVFLLVKH